MTSSCNCSASGRLGSSAVGVAGRCVLVAGPLRRLADAQQGTTTGQQFTGKPLLACIREMVYEMRLPGESQKIDRVMQGDLDQFIDALTAEDQAARLAAEE